MVKSLLNTHTHTHPSGLGVSFSQLHTHTCTHTHNGRSCFYCPGGEPAAQALLQLYIHNHKCSHSGKIRIWRRGQRCSHTGTCSWMQHLRCSTFYCHSSLGINSINSILLGGGGAIRQRGHGQPHPAALRAALTHNAAPRVNAWGQRLLQCNAVNARLSERCRVYHPDHFRWSSPFISVNNALGRLVIWADKELQ